MDENILYGVLVIIIIIVIYKSITIGFNHVTIYDKLLNGFYESDSTFCEEAGVDMFCLYIDDDVDSKGDRAMYILMSSGESLIINEPTIGKITPRFADRLCSNPDEPRIYTIEFKELSDECADVFPEKQTLRFYPIIGKIVMYTDDDVITGVFYKNCVQTELKSILKDQNDDNDDDDDDE